MNSRALHHETYLSTRRGSSFVYDMNMRNEAQRIYEAAARNYSDRDGLSDVVGRVLGDTAADHADLGQRFAEQAAIMQLASGISLESDAGTAATVQQAFEAAERRSHARSANTIVFSLLIDLTKSQACRTGADVALALRLIADYVDDPAQQFTGESDMGLDRNGGIVDSANILVGKWTVE